MIAKRKRKNKEPLQVGDLIIEEKDGDRKRRIGEILFVREGRRRVFELLELNRHDLTPLYSLNMQSQKTFRLNEDRCKRLNMQKYIRASQSRFSLGQVIKQSTQTRTRYGIIVGFLHPDELYTNSYEEGYNGKDLLECVEIYPRQGLPRKILADGKPKIFCSPPESAKTCEVLPMDKDGGVRIKQSQ